MAGRIAYFNAGHVALPSDSVIDALEGWMQIIRACGSDSPHVLQALVSGDLEIFVKRGIVSRRSSLVERWGGTNALFHSLAALASCDAAEMMLFPGFLLSLRTALDLATRLGAEQFTYTDMDHPIVISEIEQHCRALHLPAERIVVREEVFQTRRPNVLVEKLLQKKRTRKTCLFVSHIDYRLGCIIDLEELAAHLNASDMMIVDVVHSVGQIVVPRIERIPVLLLGSGHKWLGGIRSTSFVGASGEPMTRARISRHWRRSASIAFSNLHQLGSGMALRDYSSICELPLISLGVAIQDFRYKQLTDIQEHTAEFLARLIQLNSEPAWKWDTQPLSRLSGIALLTPRFCGFNAVRAVGELRERFNVAVSAYDSKPEGIRVCISHTNDLDDLAALIDGLTAYARESAH